MAVVLGLVLAAPAQTRKDLTLSSMRLREIGERTSVGYFNDYSYGLDTLRQAGSQGYGGVLQSSIGDASRMTLSYTSPAMPPQGILTGGGATGMSVDRSGGMYGARPGYGVGTGLDLRLDASAMVPGVAPPVTGAVPLVAKDALGGLGGVSADTERVSIGIPLATQDDTVFGAARAYVKALEAASTSLLRSQTQPITSLVPPADSPYREYMLKGDRAFRAGNYMEAYANFEIVNDIGGRDPESFICLTHAQFALSRYSYAKASYFLQQALKYMPELPLANLRPQDFFGNADKYAGHLVSLEEHIERNPFDGESLLLLAYLRWFGKGQDVEATRKALARALGSAMRTNDARLAEAIETFWDGMVASGKVSGKLQPASEPAAAKGGPGAETPAQPKPADKGGAAALPTGRP